MKNLRPSNKNTFETHTAILNSKRDADLVARLSVLNDVIQEKYQIYEYHFASNTLEQMSPLDVTATQKADLLKLYSFQSKIIKEIRRDITETDTNRIINTCQNCTVNAVNSLDHYVPKTSFSEFVVNPKNLFPSCVECNMYKGELWITNNEKLFLNLYLDQLPQKQYLVASVKNAGMEITFSLSNEEGIEPELFRLIESHYIRLHLLERFRENSAEVVTELVNSIKHYRASMSIEALVQSILAIQAKNRESFGFNYWKSILRIALVQNNDFLGKIIIENIDAREGSK